MSKLFVRSLIASASFSRQPNIRDKKTLIEQPFIKKEANRAKSERACLVASVPSVEVGPPSEMTWGAAMQTNECRLGRKFTNALHFTRELPLSVWAFSSLR